MIDFNRARRQTPRSNLTLAFEVAEQIYGVTPLLDPEGLVFWSSVDFKIACRRCFAGVVVVLSFGRC